MKLRGIDPFGTTRNLRRFPQGPSPVTAHYVDTLANSVPNQPITLSGDISGTGTSAIVTTLPAVNGNTGTFQGITVNGKGQVTAASNQSYLTANQTITLSGDLTGSGTTSINAQIAANAVGTAEIADANVTYAKVQNVTNNRVLGNTSGSAAAPSEIVLPLSVANGGTGATTTAAAPFLPLVGGTINPGPLVVNANAAAFVNSLGGALQLQAANSANTAIQMNGFAAATQIQAFVGGGTAASPTATAGTLLLTIIGRGYNGTAWTGQAAAIYFQPITNPWTASDNSAQIGFNTTPVGSTVAATVAVIKNAGCQFVGTNTNDNASAGWVGEYGSSVVASPGVSMTVSNTVYNITSITPTAGDYEFWGEIWAGTGGATTTIVSGSIVTTSAIASGAPADGTARFNLPWTTVGTLVHPIGPIRISTTGATTVYLTSSATFSAGGPPTAYGKLAWRRMR